MGPRPVEIRQRGSAWQVRYLDCKGGLFLAAEFSTIYHSLDEVKAWVEDNSELILRNEKEGAE